MVLSCLVDRDLRETIASSLFCGRGCNADGAFCVLLI